MPEVKVKIANPLGLHARAAAQLVRLAGRFKSTIELHRVNKNVKCDAKSILSVLTLAAAKGTHLILKVSGSDEDTAIREVAKMINEGFGEL